MYKHNSLQAGQLPQEHLPFLQNLLNFIIPKYLKQEIDDDLSVCVDERSPYGLSITGDIKIYQFTWSKSNGLTTPIEKCPIVVYTELFILSKFDNSSPSVTQDKRFVM